jgi:hypothetical protein
MKENVGNKIKSCVRHIFWFLHTEFAFHVWGPMIRTQSSCYSETNALAKVAGSTKEDLSVFYFFFSTLHRENFQELLRKKSHSDWCITDCMHAVVVEWPNLVPGAMIGSDPAIVATYSEL